MNKEFLTQMGVIETRSREGLDLMNSPKVIMLVGPSASGKSTWRANNSPKGAVYISSDDAIEAYASMRQLNYDEAIGEIQEHGLFQKIDDSLLERFDEAMRLNKTVVVDRTNYIPSMRSVYLDRTPSHYVCMAICFNLPYDENLARLRHRNQTTAKIVPEWVFKRQYDRMVPPTIEDFDFVGQYKY